MRILRLLFPTQTLILLVVTLHTSNILFPLIYVFYIMYTPNLVGRLPLLEQLLYYFFRCSSRRSRSYCCSSRRSRSYCCSSRRSRSYCCSSRRSRSYCCSCCCCWFFSCSCCCCWFFSCRCCCCWFFSCRCCCCWFSLSLKRRNIY